MTTKTVASTRLVPPSGVNADLMTRARTDYLAFNAAQPHPLPVCPRCQMPFQSRDGGYLWPNWCSTCETTLFFRHLERMIRRFGRDGTKAKLFALARNRPTPSPAAIKAGALRRIKARAMAERLALDVQIVLPQ
jgi:predicted amidophosphoribosyltransferase